MQSYDLFKVLNDPPLPHLRGGSSSLSSFFTTPIEGGGGYPLLANPHSLRSSLLSAPKREGLPPIEGGEVQLTGGVSLAFLQIKAR